MPVFLLSNTYSQNMMLVGWLSDLPAIASSGEASGIAQETIPISFPISRY
jgi:hypothetical protein